MEVVARFALIAAVFCALAGAGCSRTDAGPESAPAGAQSTASNSAVASAAESYRSKPEASANDFAITAKVKAALLSDPALDALAIHVATQDGAVTLSGNVDSTEKKSRAREVAAGVPGVQRVVDDLALARP